MSQIERTLRRSVYILCPGGFGFLILRRGVMLQYFQKTPHFSDIDMTSTSSGKIYRFSFRSYIHHNIVTFKELLITLSKLCNTPRDILESCLLHVTIYILHNCKSTFARSRY